MTTKALFLAVLCAALLLPGVSTADNKTDSTDEHYIVIGGLSINGTNVCTAAAGAADQYSDAIPVGNTQAHALDYSYVAANAGSSFVLTVQKRAKWGDWIAFPVAVTVTLAGSSGSGSVALNLPVSSEIRIVRSSDATYATTLTACVLSKY